MRFFLFFFILNCITVRSQIVKGNVTNDDGEVVGFANVLIKKVSNPNAVYLFTSTDENGSYSIKLPDFLDAFIVEVTSVGHETQQKNSPILQKVDYPFQLDFVLLKRTTSLKEIIIKVREKPVKIKNDTTTFNPNSFKDGTEKVVEDLLKKLPGVQVESNGEIKFKGKNIKKMLLDGDDLFDSQYVVGSKNIDVDMVENIQAIENFNENTLLKGISSSDDVALNIKLKKSKTSLSGNAKLSYGVKDSYNSSVTGLLLNYKSKNFGLLSHNNIGINNSPYSVQSDIISVENSKEENLLSKEIIRQGNLYSQLEDIRSNLNNNFFTNLNSLQKLSKNITFRVNAGIYSDLLTRGNSFISQYNLPNENTITITESENLEKKPQVYSGTFQLLKKTSTNNNWEYLGKIKYQHTDFTSLSRNNTENQNNIIKSSSFFTKQNFNYTTLINKEHALVGSAIYSNDSSPQNYNVSPGVAINNNAILPILENNQRSKFRKEVIQLKLDFLGSYKFFKYSFKAGFNSEQNKYDSSLSSLDSNNQWFTNNNFTNNLNYTVTYPFSQINTVYQKGKYACRVSLSGQYFNIKLNDYINEISTKKNNLILVPDIKFIYKLTSKSSVIAGYNYNQTTPNERNMYGGFVQVNYRVFQNNEISLDFLKTHNLKLMFNYNDFLNLTRIQAFLNYNNSSNAYFNKSEINTSTSSLTYFLSKKPSDNYNIFLFGEKYFHFIKTTVQLNSNFDISKYYNIVNNSDLREVETKTLNLELKLRTGFKSALNLETKSIYTYNSFNQKNSLENHFSSLNQNLKIIYDNKKNIVASTHFNFLSSDLSVKNHYYFIDAEVTFTPKNSKIEYSLIGRNLSNIKTFEMINISDYSKTVSTERLINRYIMAVVSFKF